MQKENLYLYVASSEGSISLYLMDPGTGELTFQHKLITKLEPSFLAASKNGKFLYSTLRDDNISEVACYSIEKTNGKLSLISKVDAQGARPVHLSLDSTDKYLFQANYKGGNFSVFSINPDGSLNNALQTIKIGENAHQIRIDKNNKYIYVTHLGSDFIAQYIFDDTGKLEANDPAFVYTAKGSGPRHFDFHPNGKWLYVLNELNSTVSSFNINNNGTLKEFQNISTIPADYKSINKTADIHVSQDGKFVYCSNRGHDSIVVFKVDKKTGDLKLTSIVRTQGEEPRNFTLDPYGNFLIAGNRSSDSIIVFKVNKENGMLDEISDLYNHKLPLCHLFVDVPN